MILGGKCCDEAPDLSVDPYVLKKSAKYAA